MVAGADRDALVIQDRADVVGVGVLHDERNYSGFVGGGADDFQGGDFLELGGGVGEELVFVRGDIFHAD